MLTCERCNRTGDSSQIKKCPNIINSWKNKNICKNCFIILYQDQIKENKQIENNTETGIRCQYCGSPIEKKMDRCLFCKTEFTETEKNQKLNNNNQKDCYEKLLEEMELIWKKQKKYKEKLKFEPDEISFRKPVFFGAGFVIIVILLIFFAGLILPAKYTENNFYGEWELLEVKGATAIDPSSSDSSGIFAENEKWKFNTDKTLVITRFQETRYEQVKDLSWNTDELDTLYTSETKTRAVQGTTISYTNDNVYEYQFENNGNQLKLLFNDEGRQITFIFKKL